MALHGKNFIGSKLSAVGQKTFHGFNPRTGQQLSTAFHQATEDEIDQALNLAADAFPAFRESSPETVAAFLEAIAQGIEALGDQLIEQTASETGLGRDRLVSERGRTMNQLRIFASLVREGSFVDARIDTALPDRKPIPRPDLRRMLIPLGPVVVFGASNFPLAYSVAGGDTASAFAAKNPVIVKGHPAHPGTSELVAGVIAEAVKRLGLPEGTFSMLHAVDPQVSLALVQHPAARAAGFTGSERAGRAIFDAAAQRPDPIPVYAEMGSINPVFVLPGALKERTSTIAQGLASSINLGAGQFCTCPGLVIGIDDAGFHSLRRDLTASFEQTTPTTMVHPNVLQNYERSVARTEAAAGLTFTRTKRSVDAKQTQAPPVLFDTDVDTWLSNEDLAREIFGPSAILVRGKSEDELLNLASALPGSLTASIHGTPEDLQLYRKLVSVLETKAGRLIFNGYPTGVEVSPAMNHGGPYPATTDSKFTSVGTAAILRFLRPVCYQNFPKEALPAELQNENPRQIWRTLDGKLTKDPVK
jgi:NADP-dependent aldehyde dehydrogenase